MGPRSHERGNPALRCDPELDGRASMGPRSHERGNIKQPRRPASILRLASMGPRSHERGNMALAPTLNSPVRALQWGRVLMNAGNGDPKLRCFGEKASFNGAAFS